MGRRRLILAIISSGAVMVVAVLVAWRGDSSQSEPPATAAPTAVIVPAGQFVMDVCVPWNTFYVRYLELFNGFVASQNIVEHKQKLIAQITEMEKASQGLVAVVPSLTEPNGPGGAEIRQVIVDLFLREQRTFARYLEGLQKLDTSNDSAFQEGLQTLIDSAPDNDLEVRLGAIEPLGPEIITLIDQAPNHCGIIFIAF